MFICKHFLFFYLCKDASLSVDDLLGQYSAGVKRRCPETPPTAEPLTTHTSVSEEKGSTGQSRPRNRFATLLQWRNRSEEGAGEQGTRSRYKSMMGNLPKECILLLSHITIQLDLLIFSLHTQSRVKLGLTVM